MAASGLRGFALRTIAVLCIAAMWVTTASTAGAASNGAITNEGTLRAHVADDFEDRRSTTSFELETADGAVTRVLPTALDAEPGDRVVVRGEMHGGDLVGSVEAESNPLQMRALDVDGQSILRPHKVAVLLVRTPGDLIEPWNPQVDRKTVFTAPDSANAFFQEESYGQLSLVGKLNPEGDVFGWYTVPYPSDCSVSKYESAARKAAEADGVSLASYDHIIVHSTAISCGWEFAGIATLGGRDVLINGGGASSMIFSHELGHNLGFLHASSLVCTESGSRVTLSDSCVSDEYGDHFDAMGGLAPTPRHNITVRLGLLGVLTAQNVETVWENGTYTITSALNPTESPTALRIPASLNFLGNPGSWYYLEIRQRGGVFENFDDPSMSGVSIRRVESGSEEGSTPSYLLDAVPSEDTASDDLGFYDAPLAEGQTFDGGTARVTVLSVGDGTATVSVKKGELLDREPPSAPGGLSAGQGPAGVKLHWQPSSDEYGISRYVVLRDRGLVGIAPATSFTDAGAAPGQHVYVVYAEDTNGNTSAPSATAVVEVEDLLPPTAPANLSASAAPAGVALSWNPSSDEVGVSRYLVQRDGTPIATTASTTFTDTGAVPGTHTYVVSAEDAAGNRSPNSAPASVSVDAPPLPGSPAGQASAGASQGPAGSRPASPRKPALRWRLGAAGAIRLEADARRDPGVVRLQLWLGGRLLRSANGQLIRFTLKPGKAPCAPSYTVSARAYGASGAKAVTTKRIAAARRGRRPCGALRARFHSSGGGQAEDLTLRSIVRSLSW